MITWIYEGILWAKRTAEESGVWPLLVIGLKITGINLGAYALSNYDKILGSMLSAASFIYVCIKIYKELKKPKA
jgi:hypothetical protein